MTGLFRAGAVVLLAVGTGSGAKNPAIPAANHAIPAARLRQGYGGSTEALGRRWKAGSYRIERGGAEAESPKQSTGWDAVLTGYRAALKKSGIVGSSLTIVRDGNVIAHASEGLAASANATARQAASANTARQAAFANATARQADVPVTG